MSLLEAIILGVIQGIGEFLPVSSSAHLILVPFLFNFSLSMSTKAKLAFDVALHFGTLISVIVVFWKDWLNLFKGAFNKVFKHENSFENKMFWYLVCATIPGALIGYLFEDVIENVLRSNILLIALCLAIVGVLIYVGDMWASKHYKKETTYEKMTFKQTFLIGLSQSLAVIPGFSRSGITILTGRLLGVSREGVAKFTFLLSTPIIFGAAVLNIKDLMFTKEVILGIAIAAITGIICIKFLLNYVKKHDFKVFGIYRIILGILVLLLML